MPAPNEIVWAPTMPCHRPDCINNFCAKNGTVLYFYKEWKTKVFTASALEEIGAEFEMNDDGSGLRRLIFKSEKHKLIFELKYS